MSRCFHRGFFGWRSTGFLALLAGVAGCRGPGPTPGEFAARELPAVPPDPRREAEVERITADARAALRRQDFGAAVHLAEAVVRLDPRAAVARAILGAAWAGRARRQDPPDLAAMERAEGELLVARKLAPQDAEIQLLHAEFLELDGHVTRAALALDAMLEQHPDNLDCLQRAARLRFEMGQERAAIPLLTRVLALDPKDAAATYRLAHCNLRVAEAIARKDTASPPAADAARQAFRAAAQTFRHYQALAPRDPAGLLGEAHAGFLAAREQADAAVVATECRAVLDRLDQAVQLDTRGAEAHHSRGVVLEHLGETDRALEAYRASLARDPKFLPALLNLGRMRDRAGDTTVAKALYIRALALPLEANERKRIVRYLGK